MENQDPGRISPQVRREYLFDPHKVWGTAWKIFTGSLGSLLGLTLVFHLPVVLVQYIIPYYRIYLRYGESGLSTVQYIYMIFASLVSILSGLAIAVLAESRALGQEPAFKDLVRRAFSGYGSAFWAFLLGGLQIMLFSLLLVIPGLIKAVQYYFVLQASVLRDLKGKAALDYSKGVVEGQGMRVFGYMIVLGALRYILSFTLGLLQTQIVTGTLLQILIFLLDMFLGSFVVIMLAVLFLDLEQQRDLRLEGQAEDGDQEPPASDPIPESF